MMEKRKLMKRITSIMMIIMILNGCIPSNAYGDQIYSASFTGMGKNTDEAFRKWASELIGYYRDEYACVDTDNSFSEYKQICILQQSENSDGLYASYCAVS